MNPLPHTKKHTRKECFMNKSDVTKAMLAGLAKTFNAKIVAPDEPLMDGTKKTHTVKAMTTEIIETANELLTPEDKDKFSTDEIELMRVLDIDVANLFGTACVCEDEKIDEPIVEESPIIEKAAKKKSGKAKTKVEPVVETKPVEPEPEKKVAETKKPKKEKEKETTKTESKSDNGKDRYGFRIDSIMHKVALIVESGGKEGVTVKDIRDASWNVRKNNYRAYWAEMIVRGFAEFKDDKIKLVK